jgi:rubrerythrin
MTITNRNLTAGTRLEAKYRGQHYEAEVGTGADFYTLTAAPERDLQGRHFKSLSKAANAITGNSVNGWRFWSLATGEATRLADEFIDSHQDQPAAEVVSRAMESLDAKTIKVIKRTANQRGLPASEVRYFCSACMAGFTFPEGPAPEACPEGHAATRPA